MVNTLHLCKHTLPMKHYLILYGYWIACQCHSLLPSECITNYYILGQFYHSHMWVTKGTVSKKLKT